MSDFLSKLIAAQDSMPVEQRAAKDESQLQAWLADRQAAYERSGADPARIAEWQAFNRKRYEDHLRQRREVEARQALPSSVIAGLLGGARG